jgi:serine/threonine protein kinase
MQHDSSNASINSSVGESLSPSIESKHFVPLPFAPRIEDTPPPKPRSSGPPEILPDEITYEDSDLMGHGSFGSVYKGRCRGQEVAVKVPKKQKLTMAELTSFRNEVKIMSLIYHPHVVLFLGACTALGKMQIVTELCFTDMEKYLANDKEKKQVSLTRRMQMARDAALGVNWLHSKCRIVHLDLKSANLLLDHNLRVKVTDFGFSQLKDTLSTDKAKKGTPLWMAPEVMMGNKYDEKADVYSFGIILWEILTRDVPYAHHNDYATFFRAVCVDKERPPIPTHTLPSLTHLITSCWDFDPKVRPTFEEIIFRINVVLVDSAIDCDEGRDLWKRHYLLPKQELIEYVPWMEFDAVIRKYLKRDDLNLENIRTLLVSAARDPIFKGKEVVTLDRFDKILKWFGVFFCPERGPKIIGVINELVTKSWFHGDITKEDAVERLSKQEEGTFLIRLSSTDPRASPFTLSMTNNQHRRIICVEDEAGLGYAIQGKNTVYNSLVELAEHCQDYNLLKACPKKPDSGYNPYDAYREVDISR